MYVGSLRQPGRLKIAHIRGQKAHEGGKYRIFLCAFLSWFRFSHNQHPSGADDVGFHVTFEFRMTVKQGALETQTNLSYCVAVRRMESIHDPDEVDSTCISTSMQIQTSANSGQYLATGWMAIYLGVLQKRGTKPVQLAWRDA